MTRVESVCKEMGFVMHADQSSNSRFVFILYLLLIMCSWFLFKWPIFLDVLQVRLLKSKLLGMVVAVLFSGWMPFLYANQQWQLARH